MAKKTVMDYAKDYRKSHPRTAWLDCVKQGAKMMKRAASIPTKKVATKKVVAKKIAGVSKRKVTKTTVRKEKYTISGFKEWVWTVKTNRGQFTLVAGTRAEALTAAKSQIKANNDRSKNQPIDRKPIPTLKLISVTKTVSR